MHVYTHTLDFPLVLCSPLPPNSFKHRGIPESSPHRYPTHLLSHNHYHPICICAQMGGHKSQKCTFCTHTRLFAAVVLSTTAKHLQTQRYPSMKSTQVPHTHSVSHPLPSHVYLCRNRRSRVAKMLVHTQAVDLLCSKLPRSGFKHRDMTESSPLRYPTPILSHNHYLPVCFCEEIGGQVY